MGRPKWVEIVKHLKLNGKSLKTLHVRVRNPTKSPKSDLSGSARLSLPVEGPVSTPGLHYKISVFSDPAPGKS